MNNEKDGVPAYLRRKKDSQSKTLDSVEKGEPAPSNIISIGIKGQDIPPYLKWKTEKQEETITPDTIVEKMLSKHFPIRLRGYCLSEVDAFMEEIIGVLRKKKASSLTVEKIENINFPITDNGYDMKAVDAFLDQVSDDIEMVLKENEIIREHESLQRTRQFGDYGGFEYNHVIYLREQEKSDKYHPASSEDIMLRDDYGGDPLKIQLLRICIKYLDSIGRAKSDPYFGTPPKVFYIDFAVNDEEKIKRWINDPQETRRYEFFGSTLFQVELKHPNETEPVSGMYFPEGRAGIGIDSDEKHPYIHYQVGPQYGRGYRFDILGEGKRKHLGKAQEIWAS